MDRTVKDQPKRQPPMDALALPESASNVCGCCGRGRGSGGGFKPRKAIFGYGTPSSATQSRREERVVANDALSKPTRFSFSRLRPSRKDMASRGGVESAPLISGSPLGRRRQEILARRPLPEPHINADAGEAQRAEESSSSLLSSQAGQAGSGSGSGREKGEGGGKRRKLGDHSWAPGPGRGHVPSSLEELEDDETTAEQLRAERQARADQWCQLQQLQSRPEPRSPGIRGGATGYTGNCHQEPCAGCWYWISKMCCDQDE